MKPVTAKRKASLPQINHILNLSKSLGTCLNFNKVAALTSIEAADLVRKLRSKANEKLTKMYLKFYGRRPHPSELWEVK